MLDAGCQNNYRKSNDQTALRFQAGLKVKNVSKTISAPDIEARILALRGEKVLLDSDLAQIYGVPTGALNRAIKRNKNRFPEDFLLQLSADKIMRCQIGAASRRNFRYRPYAFWNVWTWPRRKSSDELPQSKMR